MSRGKQAPKRSILPDPKFHSLLLAKFINYLMFDGKKTVAQKIVYTAVAKLAEKQNGDPIKLFEKVVETIKPPVEVRSRRVGGANYQVPMPVMGNRGNVLAFRWILEAARKRAGKGMAEKLSSEFLDILEGVGGSIKKKEDTNRMAEANRAFAHFARRRR